MKIAKLALMAALPLAAGGCLPIMGAGALSDLLAREPAAAPAPPAPSPISITGPVVINQVVAPGAEAPGVPPLPARPESACQCLDREGRPLTVTCRDALAAIGAAEALSSPTAQSAPCTCLAASEWKPAHCGTLGLEPAT